MESEQHDHATRGARNLDKINGLDSPGKIGRCAIAGSFDDSEAVKQTRDMGMGWIIWGFENNTGKRSCERGWE